MHNEYYVDKAVEENIIVRIDDADPAPPHFPVGKGMVMLIEIPAEFMSVPYDYDRHPQSAEFDFTKGANCQLWAYALLKHFGVCVPPLRSSQLWEDQEHTEVVHDLRPLDLLLFNDKNDSWGAHVAVYLGDDTVAHLSMKNGLPAICTMAEMLQIPKYRVLIGAKRIIEPNKASAR